ncbi:cell division protein FtsK [Actinoplanes italicus]|uniref:S-DNA-T family DNA segregation ATPase FtsK/SpoIIIE n=1 Tax=Actinoplanes italicus TaxID=113567 RepID=A0A2T0KJ17_9ACTN|nr:cell division protein FtsK [Actinoplanes italicus]PRX23521.1 S-DNA-T family DNA segregation ATPase FtsK/SpoIIIE [Actinoplanes italicus]GIE30017.1 cell division protein FtsK [Actinoplanes italicus]
MATPSPDGEFDWTAAEAQVGDVVDLGTARRRRQPDDWTADVDDERDELGDEPILVDPPDSDSRVSWAEAAAGRRPIVPAWLRSKSEALALARWIVGHYTHVSAYHLLRAPLYAGRLVVRAPRGAVRAVAGTARWASDAEGRPVRLAAVRREDADEYLKLSRQRDARVRLRALILTFGFSVGAIGGALLVLSTTQEIRYAVLAVLIGLLGVAGSPADKPLMDVAAVKPRVRKLTADVLTRAFLAAGLCKPDDLISFPAPIMRDGPGWRAVIDLPFSVKADTAIKKRNDLAAGLDLDEVQVWPERVRGAAGSARRLALWVADEDPYAKPSGLWPLILKGVVDVFEPFPFGEDQRGRIVALQLMFTSLLIGAIPRMGKTFAARLPALACALDPIVELHIYDGKGGQDWRAFERIAHRVGFGVRDEVVLGLVEDLRALVVDMNRRYDTIATLPADICPESKVTRGIAERRSLKLWPVLVSIDEFQRYSGHPLYGDEIVSLLTELCKVGPSVGFMISLATQKPDGKAVPTDLRDNIGTRFALKTMTWQSSEAVLGAGSYTAGHDSSRLQRAHKGVGILLGADDSGAVEEAVTVRTSRTPLADIDAVITRAHALRQARGTLTGRAAGDALALPGPAASLLDDVLTVVPASEPKIWSETLAARLGELRPETYAGWKPEQVAAALKPFGIPVGRQVWGSDPVTGEKANRKGVHREDIAAAVAERNQRRRAA